MEISYRSPGSGRQFCTVPAGMAGIFRTGAYTGTEKVVFRTGLNTGRTGPVSPVQGYIPGFGRK